MTSAQCGNRLPGKWCSGWVNSHKFIISCYRLPVRNYRLPVSCLICGTPRTVQFGFWTIETTCEWSAIESFGWLRAKSLCKTGCGCGRLILLLEPPDPPTETLVLSILHPNVHKSCWIASWLTVRRPIELAIKVPNYVNTSRPTQLFCPRSIRLILADNWKGHHWRAPADHQSRKIPI